MITLPRWLPRFALPMTEKPKSPWGGGGEGGGDGEGPKNPWNVPPGGGRPRGQKSALDELLARAKRGAGGGGIGGGGGRFTGGTPPRSLWALGAGLIVLVWLLFTSIHPIGPRQQGVVTLFGKYAGTLDPGIRLTLPAPIANVDRIDVREITTFDFPDSGAENLMLTGDQNIIDLAYSVRWDISDARDYAFQIADPRETVRATAESAMRAVIATVTLDEAIGAGRGEIETRVQILMQQILNDYHSGVRVQGVAIKKSDPPAQVNDDFKAVTAAQQEAVGNLNQARSYAQQMIAHAQGETAQFDKLYDQYKLAPEVTRRRMYYETMEKVLAKTNKTIIEAPGVVPYLPLPGPRRLSEPQATPAPVQGESQ